MGSELSDAERLIRVETKVENIEDVILRLEKLLILREQNYVTRDVFEAEQRLQQEKYGNIQQKVNDMQENKMSNRQIFPVWLQVFVSLAAVVVAIIAFLK